MRSGKTGFGEARYGKVRCGVVREGTVRCGLVWSDTAVGEEVMFLVGHSATEVRRGEARLDGVGLGVMRIDQVGQDLVW